MKVALVVEELVHDVEISLDLLVEREVLRVQQSLVDLAILELLVDKRVIGHAPLLIVTKDINTVIDASLQVPVLQICRPIIEVTDISSFETHVDHEGQSRLWVNAQDERLVNLPEDVLVLDGTLELLPDVQEPSYAGLHLARLVDNCRPIWLLSPSSRVAHLLPLRDGAIAVLLVHISN